MAKAKKKSLKSDKSVQQGTAPVWPLNEKQTFILFCGSSLVLTLILFSKYLFGPALFIFNDAGSDTLTMFYPDLVQAARYCREVGIPSWSFYVGIGSNTYPGMLLNPFHWVYIPMSAVTIAYSIAWVQAAILFLTGLVFYRFLREALFSLPVCIIGAMLYAFGGYLVVGSSWYGHSVVIFWMTLSFLGFELLLRKKNWWLFIIPFIMMLDVRSYFLILFMILYSVIRYLDVYQFSVRELLMGYKRLAICGIFGVLISLPFIGGQWHKFAYSPRVSGKVSFSEHLSSNFPFRPASAYHNLTAFFRLLSNDALGTANQFHGWKNYLEAPLFYIGLITILLVFQFFALAKRKRKLLYGALLGIWLFMIIFPWFRFAFYGFAGDYYKGALSLFIPFSLLFIGLSGLQEIINGKKPNLIVLGISYMALVIFTWFPYHESKITISSAVQLQVTLFLTLYALLILMMAKGMMRKMILPVIFTVVTIEVGLFSWPALNDRGPITKTDLLHKKYQIDDSIEAVDYLKKNDTDLFYRMDKLYGSVKTGYNDAMIQGYFGTKMYQSHNHKNYVRFLDEMGIIDGSEERNTRWLMGLSNNQFLHPLFSIKYLLSNGSNSSPVNSTLYLPIGNKGNIQIYKDKYFLPFGIAFDQYIDYDDFKNLPVDSRQSAIYQGIILEDDVHEDNFKVPKVPFTSLTGGVNAALSSLSALAGKSMKLEYFNQNRIIGSINIDKPSVIFFSVPFDSGWKAKVDDTQKELWQANIGFTGLYVEPGKHVIELYYEPSLSRTGWFGVLAAFLLGFMIYRKKDLFWK